MKNEMTDNQKALKPASNWGDALLFINEQQKRIDELESDRDFNSKTYFEMGNRIRELEAKLAKAKEMISDVAGGDCIQARYKGPPCEVCFYCRSRNTLKEIGDKD